MTLTNQQFEEQAGVRERLAAKLEAAFTGGDRDPRVKLAATMFGAVSGLMPAVWAAREMATSAGGMHPLGIPILVGIYVAGAVLGSRLGTRLAQWFREMARRGGYEQ